VAGEVAEAAGQVSGRDPLRIRMYAKPVKQINEVGRKAHAYGHVADSVFENEIPTDDPGDDFAHRGVGIGVGAAGDGDHCGELSVADGGETAGDSNEHKRKRDCRARAGAAKRFRMADEILKKRDVQYRGSLKFLAGDRSANDGEDAGAYDGAYA